MHAYPLTEVRWEGNLPGADVGPLRLSASRVGRAVSLRVALARALRCDPDYCLAQLLQQMVDLAIRPGR